MSAINGIINSATANNDSNNELNCQGYCLLVETYINQWVERNKFLLTFRCSVIDVATLCPILGNGEFLFTYQELFPIVPSIARKL